MISFEVQKNKLIFSKGHQTVIFAGEDYKKLKKKFKQNNSWIKKV